MFRQKFTGLVRHIVCRPTPSSQSMIRFHRSGTPGAVLALWKALTIFFWFGNHRKKFEHPVCDLFQLLMILTDYVNLATFKVFGIFFSEIIVGHRPSSNSQ